MIDINWDKYIPKHCARYYGWLPSSIEFKKQIRKKSIKYLTLCGEKAIDVFMFEREGVLSRDNNKRLPNVFICERNEDIASSIFALVRPPIKEALIIGPLERILTFKDNQYTRGHSANEDHPNRNIRNMLKIKGLSQRLKSHFPFDIINFDTYGNLLNPDDEANKLLYQSFKKIFELQIRINCFLLFITAPITDIHRVFQSRFRNDFNSNVSKYPKVNNALLTSVGTIDYNNINENRIKAICFAKSIVIKAARKKGWHCYHKGIYIYQNINLRKMLSSVIQFSKTPDTVDESVYVEDIIRVIENMPEYFSYEDSLNKLEVRNHLDKIVEYRDHQKI